MRKKITVVTVTGIGVIKKFEEASENFLPNSLEVSEGLPDAPARRRMTWSSSGSSEKWGILLAHSTRVKSCLSAA